MKRITQRSPERKANELIQFYLKSFDGLIGSYVKSGEILAAAKYMALKCARECKNDAADIYDTFPATYAAEKATWWHKVITAIKKYKP